MSRSLSSLGDLFTVPNLASNSPPSTLKSRGPNNTNNNGSSITSVGSSSTSSSTNVQQQNSKSPSPSNNTNKNNNSQTTNAAKSSNHQLITQQNTNNSIVPDSQEEEISPIITFGKPSFQTPKKAVVQEEEELTPIQDGNNSDVFDDSDDDVVFLGSQPPPCFSNPSPNQSSQYNRSSSDSDSDDVSQIVLTPTTNRKRKIPGSAPTPTLYSSSSDDEVSDLELDSVITMRTEASSQTPKRVKRVEKTFKSDKKKIVKAVENLKKRKRHSHPVKSKLTPPSASLQHALQMQNQPIPIGAHPHSLPPDHFRSLSYPFQQFGASASTVGPSFSGMDNFAIQHSQMIQHTIQQMPPPPIPQHLHNMIPHPHNDQILPPTIQSLQHQIQEPMIEFPVGTSAPQIDLNSVSHQPSVITTEPSNNASASTVPAETNQNPSSDPSSSNAGFVKGEKIKGVVSTNALVNLIMKFGPYCDDKVLLTKIFKSLDGMSIDEMCNEDVCILVLLHTPRSEDKKLEKEWDKKLAQKTLGPKWKKLINDYPELVYYKVYKLKPDKIREAIEMNEELRDKFGKKKL